MFVTMSLCLIQHLPKCPTHGVYINLETQATPVLFVTYTPGDAISKYVAHEAIVIASSGSQLRKLFPLDIYFAMANLWSIGQVRNRSVALHLRILFANTARSGDSSQFRRRGNHHLVCVRHGFNKWGVLGTWRLSDRRFVGSVLGVWWVSWSFEHIHKGEGETPHLLKWF